MTRWRWLFFPLLLVAAVLGYLLSRPVPPPAPSTETGSPVPEVSTAGSAPEHSWSTLEADLAGSDVKNREAALAFIARTPYQQRDQLLQLLERTRDPKIHELLNSRLNALASQLTASLPPISLRVKDAALYDVVTALNEEMGTHIQYSSGNGAPGLYTLDVKDAPFWDVIIALHRQHPFRILADNGWALAESADSMQCSAVSGPVLFYVFTRPAKFINTPTVAVCYNLVADPRLRVVQYRLTIPTGNGPQNPLELGPDSAGNTLALAAYSGGGRLTATNILASSIQLSRPDKPGTALSWLKLSATAVASTADDRFVVDDIDQKPDWETSVGNAHLQLRSVPPTGPRTTPSFLFTVSSLLASNMVGSQPPATLSITDASNTQRWLAAFGPDFGGGSRPLSSFTSLGTGPFKLHVSLCTQTSEFPVSFSLKDIPLPAKAQ